MGSWEQVRKRRSLGWRRTLNRLMAASLAGWGCVYPTTGQGLEFSSIPVGNETVILRAEGRIVAGDAERFRQALRAHPGREVVLAISSQGGALFEADEMAAAIARFRITVIIPQNGVCASACFLLFAASPTRIMDATARIGVHSVSMEGRENMDTLAVTTAFARAAGSYGVPSNIIGRLVVTPPGEMAWLTPEELRAMRVAPLSPASASVPPQSAAPPTASQMAITPVAPVPQPRAVAPTVTPQAARPTPTIVPSRTPAAVPREQTAGETPSFIQGLTDRTEIEVWREGLPSSERAGADFWALQRSQTQPQPCSSPDPGFVAGCETAQRRLTPTDLRRRSDPEYRRGWNSFLPMIYRESVLSMMRGCISDGGRATMERGFDTARDINGDGLLDYIVDFGRLSCSDSGMQYCGSGGCHLEVYVSSSGGYRLGYEGPVRAHQIQPGERPVLLLSVHGSGCGQAGAYDCRVRMTWNGERFVRSQ